MASNGALRLAGVIAISVFTACAEAEDRSADGLWELRTDALAPRGENDWIRPARFQGAALDLESLSLFLRSAPLEDVGDARDFAVEISLPTPDGVFNRFLVAESSVMEPQLAAELPDVRTYSGQGIDDPAATLRMDITPQGLHAQVLSPMGDFWIDPISRGDTTHYASYHRSEFGPLSDWVCGVERASALMKTSRAGTANRSATVTRRDYRLCVAATGEYTAFHGGTVELAQAAIVTAVNRVDGVFERECAIRLILIAGNQSVVFTDSATDPYFNSDPGAMLAQNQATLDSVIGAANYDIGHVFTTGEEGTAGIGVVCGSHKAWGASASPSPKGDPFWIDRVAHEIGHQFGAHHSFNGVLGECGAARDLLS